MAAIVSTKNIVRTIIFLAVFAAVMSITFLVEASDVPADAVVREADTVSQILDEEEVEPTLFELADVPDGLASWYGGRFHGRRTASGRRFDMHEMTAAHRTLPFGSIIRVENAKTGKSLFVEVTDRGPFIRKRVVDLSAAAAKELGVTVTPVTLTALTPEAVREFYASNDSTLLVADNNGNIRVLLAEDVTLVGETTSITKAFAALEEQMAVVIRPAERQLSFTVAKTESTN